MASSQLLFLALLRIETVTYIRILPKGVNVMALTATATLLVCKMTVVFTLSPCKKNVVLSVSRTEECFKQVVRRLQIERACMLRMLNIHVMKCVPISTHISRKCYATNKLMLAPNQSQFRLVEVLPIHYRRM